jgi:hypothetical protein
MKKILPFILLVFSSWAWGQINSLPLGSVNSVSPTTCPSNFIKGASCTTATVSCPNLPDIAVTLGTSGTAILGEVTFINGDGGTIPGGTNSSSQYLKAGLSVSQLAFATNWEFGSNNVMETACRPATLINYFYQPGMRYGVQGISAGSGAVGYALAWYGLSSEITNAELIDGPVFSDISQGCEVPWVSAVTVTPTNGVPFTDNPQYNLESGFMSTATGMKCLPKIGSTTATEDSAWFSQSILASGATLAYPSTSVAAWVCDNGLNPSAAQSYLFLSQVVTPWTLTAISNCKGAEGVANGTTPQGVKGQTAIIADMIAAMGIQK